MNPLAVVVQSFPEGVDTVQHGVAVVDKVVLVDIPGEIQPFQVFLGALSVALFQLGMVNKKAQRQRQFLSLFIIFES